MEEEISRTIRQLIDDGLEDSADKLCSLLLSSSSSASSINQSSSSLLYELQGDCAYIKEEYSRSLQLYRQSIIHGQTKKFYSIDSIEMANIHYKISQCYLKLKDKPAAIRELEIIPKELRTNKINVCLGKLYSSSELKLSATSVLKQVIKSSPLAIECMEMLVNLGVDTTEFLPKATLDNTQSNNINTICEKWISTIVQAQSAIRSSNNQGNELFNVLSLM